MRWLLTGVVLSCFGDFHIANLPIDAHNACTKTENGVTLFSGKYSRLSNLNQCKLLIEGKTWTSVEQYFQFQKATVLGYHDVAASIRATDDSMEAMYLGKNITTEDTIWPEREEQTMRTALEIKFAMPRYQLALQKTDTIVGEGTFHKVWGIGCSMGHRDAYNPRTWKGKNIMGMLLANIKSSLIPRL